MGIAYSNNFPKLANNLHWQEIVADFSELPLIEYLHQDFDVNIYSAVLEKFTKFKRVIHLGTGGSSLGPQALFHFLRDEKVKFDFFDNIDPILFIEKLADVDWVNTGVLVVSKSGNTAETLVQLATILDFFKKHGIAISQNMAVMCQTDNNALHEFAKENNCLIVPHQPDIGGRFAVFAEVGVLPGLIAGFDMNSFQKGARDLWIDFKQQQGDHAVSLAAVHLAATKLHPVNFIYAERLRVYGAWFAQAWAESLGKTNITGEKCGTTPVCAMGAVDQHSQLQLYLGGTLDKFFTFLECDNALDLSVVDLKIAHQSYCGVRDKTLKQLYRAELLATYQTMQEANLPLRRISLDEINTYNLGQLMMSAVLEILVVAKMWQVNPFDQPAVEHGKRLAIEYLNNF